jgi:hypothetical protein
MRSQIFIVAIFCLSVFVTSSVFAQNTIPKKKGAIASKKAFKNDEQSILYLTDSLSRIRVAKMYSNDPMPGSDKKHNDSGMNAAMPGVSVRGATATAFVLKLPEGEIRLNHLNKIQPSWIEKLDIIKTPEILKYHNVEKGGTLGVLTIKDENHKDALKAIGLAE